MIPIVPLKPRWDSVALGAVTSLVQREACRGGCVWGLLRIVSVCEDAYKWVLSWVELPLTHATGGAAPRAAHCQCTDWRSASRAAILACNATAGVIVRRARGCSFGREVVSGLQFDDEQDRGSKAQPDIAGISTRDAERMLSAGEEQNCKALSRTLREGKG